MPTCNSLSREEPQGVILVGVSVSLSERGKDGEMERATNSPGQEGASVAGKRHRVWDRWALTW